MIRRRIVYLVTVVVAVATLGPFGPPAASAEEAQESLGTQVAYGAASTILTVANVPLKSAMCGTTAVMSGFAYLLTFGSKPVAKDASEAVKAACTGPYIITPQRLRTDPE